MRTLLKNKKKLVPVYDHFDLQLMSFENVLCVHIDDNLT